MAGFKNGHPPSHIETALAIFIMNLRLIANSPKKAIETVSAIGTSGNSGVPPESTRPSTIEVNTGILLIAIEKIPARENGCLIRIRNLGEGVRDIMTWQRSWKRSTPEFGMIYVSAADTSVSRKGEIDLLDFVKFA